MAEPCVRAASIAEVECMILTAEALGRHGIGDMILFAATSSQRQAKRGKLVASKFCRSCWSG